ncbi:hypothetical protein AMEX_G24756, partial [Astyanax mexicanus]
AGPVGCFDVIGFSGGSVTIYCHHEQYKGSDKYFCKEKTEQCMYVKTQNTWLHRGTFSLYESSGVLIVIYRDLSLEDAGLYQCGETGRWNHTVNLRVKTDPCCLGPKTVIGHLGENVTINCSYPKEFRRNYKSFDKLKNKSLIEVIHTSDSQKGRFSISEDRRSRVISVRISDVIKEDDGAVYYCGAAEGGESVSFDSHFSEIHLQVSESKPNTNQSDSVYQSLNPNTNQSDSVYQSLNPNTNQSDSVYQSLNLNTNQSDSVYQSLNPNTNQSDSVYQSLNLNTNQSDSVYQSLNPNTNQSDSVYES